MAYTTINDPSAHFQIKLYTGNGSDGTAHTNDGNANLQPDYVWIKNRSCFIKHALMRGKSSYSKPRRGLCLG